MDAGINLGIGTDGVASNDKLDMLGETRLAALLAKAVAKDPTAAPVHKMLYAATMGGAKALGWDREIGSLEAGKSADLFSCLLEEIITHVWINGQLVVKKQQKAESFRGMSRTKALDIAHTWQNKC